MKKEKKEKIKNAVVIHTGNFFFLANKIEKIPVVSKVREK